MPARISCDWESIGDDAGHLSKRFLAKALEMIEENVPAKLASPELLAALVTGMHAHFNHASLTVGLQGLEDALEMLGDKLATE